MDHGSFGRFGLPLLFPLVLKTVVRMVKTVVIAEVIELIMITVVKLFFICVLHMRTFTHLFSLNIRKRFHVELYSRSKFPYQQ